MKSFRERWREMPAFQRILLIVVTVCSLAVIVLSIVELCGIWAYSDLLILPLAAVILLCQFLQHLRLKNRGVAWFSFAVSLFMAVVFAVKLFS